MATRAPTTFTQWHDDRNFASHEIVQAANVNKLIDDLHYLLLAERPGYLIHFPPIAFTTGSYVMVRKLVNMVKDHATDTSTDDRTMEATVKTWCTGGTTAGTIRLTTTSGSQTFTAAAAGPVWTAFADLDHRGSSAPTDTLNIEGKIDNGAGELWIAGLGLYAPVGI